MKVEIWSDVACPWCYIAKHRFDNALSQFEHRDQVEVIWRSYQLDPDAPLISNKNLNESFSQKHGLGEEAVAMNDQMRRLGAQEGLDYDFDRARYGNSFDAHRLIHFARTRGVQTATQERLFRAYFSEGKALGDIDTLVELAREVGMNAEEARGILAGEAFADVTATPTFISSSKMKCLWWAASETSALPNWVPLLNCFAPHRTAAKQCRDVIYRDWFPD